MSANILTREFINPDIKVYSGDQVFDKDRLVDMIRFWKAMLWEEYGARPGQKIGISMLEVDPYHISLIFAAGELGLGFVILDHPIGEFAMDKTKAAIFAPIDIGVECAILGADHLNRIMTRKFCRHNISVSEFDSYVIKKGETYSEVADKIFCNEQDALLWVSTSGTTSSSKPVMYTHKYVTTLAIRNATLFGLKPDSNIVHTRNMHHVSSLLVHFLPSLYASKNHWAKYTNYSDPVHVKEYVELLVDKHINFSLISNQYGLKSIFRVFDELDVRFDHPIEFNLSGFHVTKEMLDAARKYNLAIVSTFGSVDTACPLFVKRITPESPDSDIAPGLVGEYYDDGYYNISVSADNVVTIECPTCWDGPRVINDLIEQRGNLFYHIHRDNVIEMDNYSFNLTKLTEYVKDALGFDDLSVVVDKDHDCLYLVLWDTDLNVDLPLFNVNISNSEFYYCSFKKIVNLKKETFTLDTKVNVDQLRGYLQHD